MPARTLSTHPPHEIHAPPSNRLILCFDGTGNAFQGTPGDTNIVKLYNMFDRTNVSQMHYYQPGIGTYPAEGPVNVSFVRSLARKFEAVVDSALATSFDSHVIAGYRFIMRYYKPGDRIYIFGFSRGAFTARFLSRMISKVGLLSKGNDELVPFAYKVYQDFERDGGGTEHPNIEQDGNTTPDPKETKQEAYMKSFKKHFCRTVDPSDTTHPIKVHFLGLFDCVSSVGNLDVPLFKKTAPLPAADDTAEHVRHAVAVDERRVKFKAALFAQEQYKEDENIKEVWFPGNHGDIGGGWDISEKEKDGVPHASVEDDYFQLSDIALKWMMDEIDNVESSFTQESARLAWDTTSRNSFLHRFRQHKKQMLAAQMHDTMKWTGDLKSKLKSILWNVMEYIPFIIKRWEYGEKLDKKQHLGWNYISWPLNRGERRDIPPNALFHHSLKSRLNTLSGQSYTPTNDLWVPTDRSESSRKVMIASQVFGTERKTFNAEKWRLDDLASSHAKTNGAMNGDRERQSLRRSWLHFEHDEDLTTHSVDDDGKHDDWDNIYRVVLKSN